MERPGIADPIDAMSFTAATSLDGNGNISGTNDPTTILPVKGGATTVTLLEVDDMS